MSPRTSRILLWVSGFVLAAGIAAVLIVFLRDTGSDELTKPIFKNEPPTKVSTPDQVKLDPAARVVAGRFILTAVQRKNLGEAWKYAGPQIRQGMSYKQWLTGDIPVVPFLPEIGQVPLNVELSEKNYALMEVILLPKKKGIKSEIFTIELNKIGDGDAAHWVVNSWAPRSHPTIPTNQSS